MYLGAPIIHGRVTKSMHRYIVERMEQRLANWKQNVLSLAGRRTLIQSVTSSMPIYTMQSMILPASICDEIDRVNRNFLWGSTSEKRKMHHVKWSTVCLSKANGGLGLRTARDTNLSLVAKLGWKMLNNNSTPWCQAMKHKYMKEKSLWDCSKPQKSSAAWKAILQSRELLRAGAIWRIGDGSKVHYMNDFRCHFRTLWEIRLLAFPLISKLPKSLMLMVNGAWTYLKP